MRKINYLVVHCSATKEGVQVTPDQIEQWHRARGFSTIGYHYVITLEGSILPGRDINVPGAHVAGNNSDSIGICYIGGLDKEGKPKDTRTTEQKGALVHLLTQLLSRFPGARICGHRDLSPDLNSNGIIEPWEYIKACPCFDAGREYTSL